MTLNRRGFFAAAAAGSAGIAAASGFAAEKDEAENGKPESKRRQRFAVSTYSFWQFRNKDLRDIGTCIDHAAEMGFDGVELLHVQMENESNGYLQGLKRRAFLNGLDLCGFSTHQGFLFPDKAKRLANVDHTVKCIELAYKLGIPTLRVNTGRWGTSKNFDALMANRGIEPILEGYTEEDGYGWAIEGLTKCLKAAERCGVTLGLENHWGLGRTAEGVMRIVNEIDSPWLQVTLDTGNFLDDTYAQLEQIAPKAVLVQAKTYFGGGLWYALDIDYARVAKILRKNNFTGYVSLEFEGRDSPLKGIPQSLELLQTHLA
jgi:L-ribulose-5-phosphate 3-epimerase